MVSSACVLVFNFSTRLAIASILLCVVAFLFPPDIHAADPADSFDEGILALAHRTATAIHGGAVIVEARNLSSLRDVEFTHLSEVFQQELQRRGIKISASGSNAPKIVLTIAGSFKGYMAVAQGDHSGQVITELESLGFAADSSHPEIPSAVTLRKELLFSQDAPFVDVVFSHGAESAIALGQQEIYSWEFKDQQWQLTQTERLPVVVGASRELRGVYLPNAETNLAYLPGEACYFSISDHTGWHCEARRDRLPVRNVASALLSARKVPWISAAQFESNGTRATIFTGLDGLARLYEDAAEPVATIPGWGGEIASIKSGCGAGWQILATGKSDWSSTDQVQAFEIRNRAPWPVSQVLDFDGPIVALYSSITEPSQDSVAAASAKQSIAVVQNLETGRYEAYRLTISCPN